MRTNSLSSSRQKALKTAISKVFDWAIAEGFVGLQIRNPTTNIRLKQKKRKVPEVLNVQEVRALLYYARHENHPFLPVWTLAAYTGMRSGELRALRWSDVDFENCVIRVSRSYCSKAKKIKSTKTGDWKVIPVEGDLKDFLLELKNETEKTEFVLPRIRQWMNGQQAKVLRLFLEKHGLPSVRFHALRASFCTNLLSSGVPQIQVQKIGGWAGTKSMEPYVRMAGVDERGALVGIDYREINLSDNVVPFRK